MSAYSKNKRWLFLLLPSFAFLLLLLGTINYTVDPYGFFRKDLSKQLVVPNQNFLKMRYITKTSIPFNSFVFGSSRVGNIHVQNIKNGGRWYNMTYAGGVPQEHLMNIEYMIKKGIKINELLIGLDEFSYAVDPEIHVQQWSTKPYSPIRGESEWLCYVRYIFRFPDVKVFQTAYKEYQIRRQPQRKQIGTFFSDYNFYGTGQGTIKELDDEINKNPEKHSQDQKFLKPYQAYNDETDFSTDALASLKRIVELSRANGIKLTIFINPIHHTTYMATNRERLFEFKQGLSKICDYYDFSGLNAITQNNFYYYETSHYRPIVGDMLIRRFFTSDSNFGVLVTARTVERHIAQQRAEIQLYSSGSSPTNPPR
ncbi:MAG: hypothetical protein HXX11_01940 [Desulfuromonadales bacterium]|nr:hypothetical protein [Desulfuromonadales bacterium]